MRITKLLILLFIVCFTFTFSQEAFTEQYSLVVSMNGSITTNKVGTLYNNRGAVIEEIYLSANGNVFVRNNIFAGLAVDYIEISGGRWSNSETFIGPNVGYALNVMEGALYPYVNVSVKLVNYSYGELAFQKGPAYCIGAGTIITIKEHLGLNFEIGYRSIQLKDKLATDYTSGDEIRVSIGLSGLIF